jgi:HEAT repeat protein
MFRGDDDWQAVELAPFARRNLVQDPNSRKSRINDAANYYRQSGFGSRIMARLGGCMKLRWLLPIFTVVISGLLSGIAAHAQTNSQQSKTALDLVEQFKTTNVFWKQIEVAKKIVALQDTSVLRDLEPSLSNEDRHIRGNAAFIFVSLGDDRGFQAIKAILDDRSNRPYGQGVPGNWTLHEQIRADRYYAAHLFGDLKDAKAVPILIPLLRDDEVNWIVPWSLGEIGDKSAIRPLIDMLDDVSPDTRVLAIYALQQLDAKEALAKLGALQGDNATTHFGRSVSVAEAARDAINKITGSP